ncbi:MAG: cytidine deaminase [Elusimicrobia bacterium]|nr:cytidine deaminase [Elusimicrobiota bacterium]
MIIKSAIIQKLIGAAKQAIPSAYCPYSHYPVGAAVLMGSGRIYRGCNVENSSFGLTCCAERVAIFNAISQGEKEIKALCIAARFAKPCGACRQVLWEFGSKDTLVLCIHLDPIRKKQRISRAKMSHLLPQPFNPSEAGL